jgi:hypothetical protein
MALGLAQGKIICPSPERDHRFAHRAGNRTGCYGGNQGLGGAQQSFPEHRGGGLGRLLY